MALGTNSVDNVKLGSNGAVFSAPYGTALPASEIASLDALFVPVGYITPAGPSVDSKPAVKDIKAWQALLPIASRVTDIDGTVKFEIMEWKRETLDFAFGGGTLAEPTSGHYTFEPGDPSEVDERSLVIDVHDGTDILRIVFERGYNVGGFTTSFTRDEAAILPIEWKILIGSTYDRGIKFMTNIASFEPAA